MTHQSPVLLAAPFRPFFLAGVVQILVAMALWLAILCGWYVSGAPVLHLAVGAIGVHAFLMLFGLFPFFVFGFALTALPRWMGHPPIPKKRYATIAGCMVLGIVLAYVGFFVSRILAGIGGATLVAGWGLGVATLLQIWRHSDRDGKNFSLFPIGCISAGCFGATLMTLWLFMPQLPLLNAAINIGLWLFLVPLIVAVSYRMLPLFSSWVLDDYQVIKPGWTLPATLLCVVVHCILAVSGLLAWSVFCDLPLALMAAWHTWQWKLPRSLSVPLLGMLHISFAWLSIAMALYTINSILQLSGSSVSLGMAPLHALGIGYICSMVIGMVTRVIHGHSGRKLIAGRVAMFTFIAIQITAVVRVLADFSFLGPIDAGLVLAAAILWLVGVLPWALRNAAITLRPRVDGRPG